MEKKEQKETPIPAKKNNSRQEWAKYLEKASSIMVPDTVKICIFDLIQDTELK